MATTCDLNSPSSLPNCDGTNIRTITLSPIKLSRSLTEALNLVSLLFNRLSKTSLSPQHSWSSQLFLYFRFWQLLFVTYTLVVKMVLNTWYLCISMAYKVIECIVFTQNTQSWKSLFSLYKTSQITKNSPKNRSLNRDFLNFLNRYGIFWVVHGESSCYRRPKLTLISGFVTKQMRCQKKLTLFLFLVRSLWKE